MQNRGYPYKSWNPRLKEGDWDILFLVILSSIIVQVLMIDGLI